MIKSPKLLNLNSKKVLIRVDFNVPLNNGQVQDQHRIKSSLPTIKYCLKRGASIILCSHLGRPNGKKVEKMSLLPVGETLADLLEMPIKFSMDCVSEDSHDVTLGLKPGEIHLLENLRFHKGETENDPSFSSQLAKHGDVFINDAFGTSHRSHASNVGVVPFFSQRGIGFLIENELKYLGQSIKSPARPFILILGGAKIKGKLNLILKLVEIADSVLIGGGMAFTFLKAKGKEIGSSLVDDSMIPDAKKILSYARNNSVKVELPVDVVVAESVDAPHSRQTVSVSEIPKGMGGFDIGPETIQHFSSSALHAGTVLWNGPMGVFEEEGFENGTRQLAESLAADGDHDRVVIVGGGDTAAAVNTFGLANSMSHVSTGGGASLELLSGNLLPAISILEKP